ncbi:MAG: IS66 family transposase [Gammaproteobacteria bacterium]|nr:MAG: IS66 family transposase [Gammaproteobacteria bacterium]
MTKAPQLPDDIEALKSLLIEQNTQIEQLQTENNQYKTKVLTLQEQLNLAIARRYAASSEKIPADQFRLFDEAEVDNETENDDVLSLLNEDDDSTSVAAHTRKKKTGRKALPDSLVRVDEIHSLSEAERVCEHDGNVLNEIGEVISEQLDIIPAKIQVIRHIRKKYACDCGKCIKTAPMPNQPIPKSLASPGLLAHITVSKYQDALPLYRQEQILQRIGVTIPRATLANWMIQSGTLIQPVINLLRDRLLSYDILHMDETTVQVLDEPNKKAQSKSYLWVQRGGPPDKPVILFDYDAGRGQSVPLRLLEGFKGTIQTDGYAGYNAVVNQNNLMHLGCWAHARRKFSEAVKAQGKGKNKNKKTGKAQRGLAFIQKLYKIEKALLNITAEERFTHRQQQSLPVLEKFKSWLDESIITVPPKSAVGNALQYLNNEWDKLIRYTNDGRYLMDNNLAENAIRPFVIGRKNWLFSQSVKGVKASANLYSLNETAKTNGLEPYAYLRILFSELPKATTLDEIEKLLPGNIDLKEFR